MALHSLTHVLGCDYLVSSLVLVKYRGLLCHQTHFCDWYQRVEQRIRLICVRWPILGRLIEVLHLVCSWCHFKLLRRLIFYWVRVSSLASLLLINTFCPFLSGRSRLVNINSILKVGLCLICLVDECPMFNKVTSLFSTANIASVSCALLFRNNGCKRDFLIF